MKKKRFSKAIVTGVVAVSAYTTGVNHEAVRDTITGKKEYVVLNNGRYAVQAFNEADADVKQTLDNSGGYVVKMTDAKAKEIEEKGFEVYENRIYTVAASSSPPCQCYCDGEPPVRPVDPITPGPLPPPVTPNPKQPIAPPEQINDEKPWGTLRVKAMEARAKVNSSGVLVCIIDTGIDSDHPDLRGTFVGGKSFVQGNASFEDDQGHGTHVAGTISALANNQGIVGVSQAQLYIVKALDSRGSGTGAAISEGIYQCARAGAKVINMSLGSPYSSGPDRLIEKAVKAVADQGVIVVAAAGNDGGRTGWPAAIEYQNVYAVAASDSNNRITNFSSRGPEIDFIAPGGQIKSSKMGGGYVTWDGTSMAAPHVAAVFAMAVAQGKNKIKANNIGLPAEHQGQGLVDALRTVSE